MISEMLTLLSLLVSNTGAISTHEVAFVYDETSTSTVDFYGTDGGNSFKFLNYESVKYVC